MRLMVDALEVPEEDHENETLAEALEVPEEHHETLAEALKVDMSVVLCVRIEDDVPEHLNNDSMLCCSYKQVLKNELMKERDWTCIPMMA